MVEFNHTRRAKFKESIARAAAASPADVTIDNVESIFSSARDFPVNYSGVNNTTAAAWNRRVDLADEKEELLGYSVKELGYVIGGDDDPEVRALLMDVFSDEAEQFPVNFSGVNKTTAVAGNRRLLTSTIRIDVIVMAQDKAAADAIVARLTYHNINAELALAGFPRAEVVVKPFTQSLSGDRMSPFPLAPVIGGAVGGVVLIGMAIAYWWCWRQRNTFAGQQSAVPRPSESAQVTVPAQAMRPRRPPSAPPPAAPWNPPPTLPPAPSAPSLSAVVPLPFAATSARAAPCTRPGSQSQPENVIMGDVYDPSLSEMRAWQQQPVEQEETPCETGSFQEEEETTVRDRMPSGPPRHPALPSAPAPPQPPEAPRKRECVVCHDKEPTMAMIPCGHVCACEDCAEFLHDCPMCRAPVLEARRIYLV